MPNDPAGQFPQPPSLDQTQPEIKLTDDVAPDISKEAPPPPVPAVTPPISRPFPIVTVLLLLISVAAMAASYFFFQQSRTLNQQLAQIEQILEQQKIKQNQVVSSPTPTPETLPDLESSPAATPTGGMIIPTTTVNRKSSVFGQVDDVLALAGKKYPASQLLMITASEVGTKDLDGTTIKYWFRQTEKDKRYLYILSEGEKELALVDQQVYVSPDNNIPSLNTLAKNDQLGLDLTEAVKIALANCPAGFDCASSPITAQYIKASVTLWQISFKPGNGKKPFVIQIDALTKKILYKNQ